MSQVVRYTVDGDTVVGFEIEPVEGFAPASAERVVGEVREAIEPAITAARAVLAKVRELSPDGVEVTFGIKVTGTANWLVAKAATEGSFQVTLSWTPSHHDDTAPRPAPGPRPGLPEPEPEPTSADPRRSG